jgi:hypothetical protein
MFVFFIILSHPVSVHKNCELYIALNVVVLFKVIVSCNFNFGLFFYQENLALEEQITLLQQKEEDMKSLQEEISTLEEVRFVKAFIVFRI